MLPVKKIYVDTKYKTKDSISNSNFKIELPETVFCPENTVFYIDDVSIPHSWQTVENNVNDKIYLFLEDTDLSLTYFLIVDVANGNYSGSAFTFQVESALNLATTPIDSAIFSSTYNVRENTMTINSNYSKYNFQLLTPNEIASNFNGLWDNLAPSYDVNNPHDANEILNNLGNSSTTNNQVHPYVSGFLNLQPIRNLYIHSPSLGSYKTIGPRHERTIIKKVSVSANYNEMIFDQVLTGNDFTDCSLQTLRTIEFHIRDSRGNYVNFHGSNLSFSIIFSKMNPNI
jgi:hypothetical protein